MDKRLEERYIVIKLKDLDDDVEEVLRQLIKENDIRTIDCVVVEEDWPEYKPTVDAIMTRVTKESLPPMPDGAMPWDDPDTYGPS